MIITIRVKEIDYVRFRQLGQEIGYTAEEFISKFVMLSRLNSDTQILALAEYFDSLVDKKS